MGKYPYRRGLEWNTRRDGMRRHVPVMTRRLTAVTGVIRVMGTFNKYNHYRGIFTRKIHGSILNATNDLVSDAPRRIWFAAARSDDKK